MRPISPICVERSSAGLFIPPFLKAKADAVTSVTITSAAIFRGLNEGQVIFKELKKKGLI